MKFLLIAVLLALAGCASDPTEKYGEVIKVQWIALNSHREMAEKCGTERIRMTDGGSSNPFAYFRPRPVDDFDILGCYREIGDVCVIYTFKPVTKFGASRSDHEADRSVMETVGHEIEHCYRGRYHAEG